MAIALGPGDRALLNPHEANALALLLSATGTRPAESLAAKLHQEAARLPPGNVRRVEMTPEERKALLRAITEFPPDCLPRRLEAIRDALRGA